MAFWQSNRGNFCPGATKTLTLVGQVPLASKLSLDILPSHGGNSVYRNALRADRLALSMVGTVTEAFPGHLVSHGYYPSGSFWLTLGKQSQMTDFSGGE